MTTEIKTKDLLFYPSAQLNQNDDGGGLLVKKPLTDATSEVFDPTSAVQKVNGGFTARLVYPAVLTEGKEKLLGSYCAVSRIPDAENEDVLLFAGDYYGEEWKNAKNRIEAYSTPTIFSKYTLLGFATKNSRHLQCYCRPEEDEPVVGQTLCLRLRLDRATLEYIRVGTVSSEIRTFTDNSGNTFQKKVIKIETTDILASDWEGIDYPVMGKAEPPTLIWETHISDAALYYGASRITQDITAGNKNILAERIYGQLVPCTTTNQAHADQYPAANNFYIPLGRNFSLNANAGDFYASHGILPNSFIFSGTTDNGWGELNYRNNIYSINYSEGIAYKMPNGNKQGQLATLVSNAAYTTFIDIDDTNQQTEWSVFLDPAPARGSVHISWLTNGVWYDYWESGDRRLRNAAGVEKGIVSRDGSATFSLSDMPDAYSQIVVMWSPEAFFRNYAGSDLETTVSAQTLASQYIGISKSGDERPLVPETITVKAGTKSATDDGNGNLTGDFTGTVEYGAGFIQVNPQNLTSLNITVECQRYSGKKTTKRISPEITLNKVYFRCGSNIVAGSLKCFLIIKGIKTVNETTRRCYKINEREIKSNKTAWLYGRYGNRSNAEIMEVLGGKTTATVSAENVEIRCLTDNSKGGLLLDGVEIEGSVDYDTGVIYADFFFNGAIANLNEIMETPSYKRVDLYPYDTEQIYTSDYSFDVELAVASYYETNTTEADTFTTTTGLNTFNLLNKAPVLSAPVFNSWMFEINNKIYYENRGEVFATYNALTGLSDKVGSIDSNGVLSLELSSKFDSIKILTGIYTVGGMGTTMTCGRTPACPVVPQSFNCRVWTESGLKTAVSTAEGTLEGEGISGTIDYKTGFFIVYTDDYMQSETLKFNCTSLNYIPVNRNIIGIDTVRLRNDGKTLIFRAGDTVLIYDRKIVNLPEAIRSGTECYLERTGLDRVAVRDKNGMRVPADYYDENLSEGKITFNHALNLSGFKLPLYAVTSREELNRVVKADFSGLIELQNPISRSFAADGDLYISSCFIKGDLESQYSTPFSQVSWTNEWSDERIGNELLAKLNVTDYPITLTNEGSITQRWLLQFTSKTQFNIIGENIGLVGQSDTLQECSPINPQTLKPYFTIPKQAFSTSNGSSLWASGNCIRFNTTATNFPMWIIKTVQPISHENSDNLERTQFEVLFAGDSIVLE